MADNQIDLYKWQVGTQSVFGTAVAQTAKLMGITGGSIQPNVSSSEVQDVRGTLTPGYTATLDAKSGEAGIEGDALYEDMAYWLDNMFGQATPSGAGPYVRAYSGAGAVPAPRILTLAHGSGVGVQSLVGALISKFSLAFEPNKRATIKADMIGYGVENDTLDSLADRTVIPIHSNDVTLYVDAWGGTVGTTAITLAKFNIGLDLDLNRKLLPGIASASPADWKQHKGESKSNTLTLALEVDTASKAYLDSILASTSSGGPLKLQVRIKAQYAVTQILQIDFAGFIAEAPEAVSDSDGVAQFEFQLQALYHSTMASWINISLTNQVSSLS